VGQRNGGRRDARGSHCALYNKLFNKRDAQDSHCALYNKLFNKVMLKAHVVLFITNCLTK